VIVSTLPLVHNTPNNFKGGKLSLFLEDWKEITSDSWILNTIQGYTIDIDSSPCQYFVPKPILFNKAEKELVSLEVHQFLDKGIIEEIHTIDYGQYYSNIFIRPKKDGTVRVILNLKKFNDHVPKVHFKMETLKSALTTGQKSRSM
jgi:hypothetical protein